MRLDAKRKEYYQKQYSRFFDMKILKEDFEQMPMLSYVVSKFKSDIEVPSKEIQVLLKQNLDIMETLDKTLSPEQAQLFYEFNDVNAQLESIYKEKVFVLGFLMGKKLTEEVKE